MRQSIGLIGPGAMGRSTTQALVYGGFAVFVRDIDPARNALARGSAATVCVSPAEVASCTDIIVTVMVDAKQTDAVCFGPAGLSEALKAAAPSTAAITGFCKSRSRSNQAWTASTRWRMPSTERISGSLLFRRSCRLLRSPPAQNTPPSPAIQGLQSAQSAARRRRAAPVRHGTLFDALRASF